MLGTLLSPLILGARRRADCNRLRGPGLGAVILLPLDAWMRRIFLPGAETVGLSVWRKIEVLEMRGPGRWRESVGFLVRVSRVFVLMYCCH